MAQGNARSLQERVARLGLTKDWQRIAAWATQAKNDAAPPQIVALLEDARASMELDVMERLWVIKVAGRRKSKGKGGREELGMVDKAAEACAELAAAITRIEHALDRIGLDLVLAPTALERERGWDPKKYAAMANRALWTYDSRLARTMHHLVAARRTLAEPPPDPPDEIKFAIASHRGPEGKGQRPRQTFHLVPTRRRLGDLLVAIAPAGERRQDVRAFAHRLLAQVAERLFSPADQA